MLTLSHTEPALCLLITSGVHPNWSLFQLAEEMNGGAKMAEEMGSAKMLFVLLWLACCGSHCCSLVHICGTVWLAVWKMPFFCSVQKVSIAHDLNNCIRQLMKHAPGFVRLLVFVSWSFYWLYLTWAFPALRRPCRPKTSALAPSVLSGYILHFRSFFAAHASTTHLFFIYLL